MSDTVPGVTVSEVLDLLNSMLATDPTATHALVINRVPCNDAMVEHPFVVVDSLSSRDASRPTVGLLGVLNGLLLQAGSKDVVAIHFDDQERKLVGLKAVPFLSVSPPPPPPPPPPAQSEEPVKQADDAKHEVYARSECIFHYCPYPETCRHTDTCQHPCAKGT